MPRRSTIVVSVVVGLVLLALVVLEFGLWLHLLNPGEYDRGTVTVVDEGGEHLGAVDARIANTSDKRAIGLSRTDSLGADEGMLFVHESEGRHRYVMRGMAFPLDIVFVDANGTVTEIHHASTPSALTPEFMLERFAGDGQYVLEVERGWTNGTGVDEGDRVVLPEGVGDGAGDGGDDGEQPTVRPSPTATATEPDSTATPERPTVTAADANGTALGTVAVRIADDESERYTGLSETDSLGPDEGMLFVYDDVDRRAFVMRNMSFPLDIVFVDANGTVSEIHHASTPPPEADEEDLRRYRGTGQYVLEVNRGWTNETGLDEDDTVRVPDEY